MSTVAKKVLQAKPAAGGGEAEYDTLIAVGNTITQCFDISDIDNISVLDDVGNPTIDILYNNAGIDRTNEIVIAGNNTTDEFRAIEFSDTSNLVSTSIYDDATVIHAPRANIGIDEAGEVAYFLSALPTQVVSMDYSNLASVSILDELTLDYQSWGLVLDKPNDVLYITTADRVSSFDVSNPASMSLLDTHRDSNTNNMREMVIDSSRDVLFGVATNDQINSFDISNPSSISTLDILVEPTDLDQAFTLAYDENEQVVFTSTRYGKLASVDVSNTSSLSLLDSIQDTDFYTSATFDRSIAIDKTRKLIFLKNGETHTLSVVSYEDPSNLTKVQTFTASVGISPYQIFLFNR